MKKFTSLLALFVAFVLSLGAPAGADASDVHLGTLTPFTGGDAGEGLDLDGNIIYAFNLGGPAQTVQGVDFVDASVEEPPAGIAPAEGTLDFDYSTANPGGANGADYGPSGDDDALESVVNHVWYNSNWTFDLAVVSGTPYKLQLIFQESWFPAQGDPRRNFDVSVETAPATLSLVIDDLVQGQETNGASPAQPEADFGLVYQYTFKATDSSFQVALDDNPEETGDPNAILAAVTLEQVFGADFIAGDFNEDGVLDLGDFNVLVSKFNMPGAYADGDFDFSGQVDLGDFVGFRLAWEANVAGASSVPEPSCLALFGISFVLMLRRTRTLRRR